MSCSDRAALLTAVMEALEIVSKFRRVLIITDGIERVEEMTDELLGR